MSEQAPGTNAIPPVEPKQVNVALPATGKVAMEDLLAVILAREARLAAKEAADLERDAARKKQYAKNAESHNEQRELKQARCNHLKGGKHARRGGQQKDFAVYLHTYIDRKQKIKCFLCGGDWRPGDTKEFLIREGKKVRNHTQIGWNEACDMVSNSTNQPSSSEIPMQGPDPRALLMEPTVI